MGGWVGGGSIASHFYIYIYDCRSRVQAPPSPLSPQWYGEGDADAADNPEEALQETPGQGEGACPGDTWPGEGAMQPISPRRPPAGSWPMSL